MGRAAEQWIFVGFVFRQQGTTLRGTAQYWLVGEGNKRTDGTINGTIKGKVISFAVRWSNGAVGDYFGEVNDDGTIQGGTFDARGRTANWIGHKSQKATCVLAIQPRPRPGTRVRRPR